MQSKMIKNVVLALSLALPVAHMSAAEKVKKEKARFGAVGSTEFKVAVGVFAGIAAVEAMLLASMFYKHRITNKFWHKTVWAETRNGSTRYVVGNIDAGLSGNMDVEITKKKYDALMDFRRGLFWIPFVTKCPEWPSRRYNPSDPLGRFDHVFDHLS